MITTTTTVAETDYSFAYDVQDPKTGNYQNQKETRFGDVVKGEYSVLEADGSIRRVVYTADSKNGFQATVHIIKPNHLRQSPFTMTSQESNENFFDNYNENYQY
ncbi:cutile protein 18.6, isoform B, putative [Pediculus humanus corporis]|uniref:Cutile protein 18.6, isoform B, putative n=1 Tax=Pediculus humanus subsp. corporis TaxID=121224 RepID=E0VBE0_PEDHC|nr:cutile protein 18.6, isoform B, putative [Pediculus humanus corporis]EEB10696.1 cutile protein 18.6, isoform B, putative [Pediculus humanus corporis]